MNRRALETQIQIVNGKVTIDGKEVDSSGDGCVVIDRNGTHIVNNRGGQINIASGNSKINITSNNSSSKVNSYGKCGMNNDNYIVNGSGTLLDKNIIIHGNLIVNGMSNYIKTGMRRTGCKDLEIPGDLIINGMSNKIGCIMQLDGKVLDRGMNNIID